MVATRAGKRAAAGASNPLSDAGILKQVLSYAGAGEFIFYAPISKLWLECYRAVPAHRVKRQKMTEGEVVVEVLPCMTLRRTVFSTAARVKLAHALGLQFSSDDQELQYYTDSMACKTALVEAHRLGMPVTTDVLNSAASTGELSTVIWLYTEHNCALSRLTSVCSASDGQIEVLRWLKQQGEVFNATTMSCAANSGQHATCAYLHSEGCDWNEATVYMAAHYDQCDTVRWIHEYDCPWRFELMCLKAAELGDVSAMTYLIQQEPVAAPLLLAMLKVAGAYDHLAAAQWLRQRGAAWPSALRCGGKDWSGDVLEWATAEGCDSPLNG
jgi:hypothetical protein